jgi:hypothetical protein
MRGMRRMGIMTRNHSETFILLLQDELWSERATRRVASGKHRVRIGVGQNSADRRGARARRGDCAADENRQLAREAAEKFLSVTLHTCPSGSRNSGCHGFYANIGLSSYIFIHALRSTWDRR